MDQETHISNFETRWRWITKRAGGEVNVVQERHELEHIYNLMEACECGSYLEVGCAEGGSLYVLGHMVKGAVDIIDFGEIHTTPQRDEVILELGKPVRQILGDSTKPEIFQMVRGNKYDCVLIDGGHDFDTVFSDCVVYGTLATKYIFFHDVQLPEVAKAIKAFLAAYDIGDYSTFINSSTYGYGILKCR